jgi:tetratricopeptide (TPR) repeat protein
VAWASERKDVLAACFFFLTLLAYERYVRAPSWRRYAGVTGLFALGLLAKPMLVTLPCVLLFLDAWPFGRIGGVKPEPAAPVPASVPVASQTPIHPTREAEKAPFGRFRYGVFLEKLPLFALSGASCLVTVIAQQTGGAVQSMQALSLAERVATAILGTVGYLSKAFVPRGLAFFYPHPAIVAPATFSPFGGEVVIAALALLACTLGAWLARRRFPEIAVGWAWMLVMLLPVIGLVQVGSQFMADRYAYLPLLGPTFALVFAMRRLPRPRTRHLGFGIGLLAAGALASLTHGQVGTWRDSRVLCEHALAVTERNAVAHEHLGLYLQRQQDLEGARQQYLEALAIDARAPSTHGNLGAIYVQLGQRDAAEKEFQAALRLDPEHLATRMSLGLVRELEGDLEGAVEHYSIAVRQHPDESEPLRPLAEALRRLGRTAQARETFESYARSTPPSAEIESALGECATELGDGRAALAHFAAAERIQPDLSRALHGRAWLLATSADRSLRDGPQALERLARCAAQDGAQWPHLRTQAAALAAVGRMSEALASLTEAWATAPEAEWERLKAERELYQQGRALER